MAVRMDRWYMYTLTTVLKKWFKLGGGLCYFSGLGVAVFPSVDGGVFFAFDKNSTACPLGVM